MTRYLYRIISVIIVLCFVNYLFAQDQYNKVFKYDNQAVRNEIIHETDDAYYTIGYSDDFSGYTVGIHVSKHDKISSEVLNNTYFAIDSIWCFLEVSRDVYQKENLLIIGLQGEGLLYKLEYNTITSQVSIIDTVSFPIEYPGLYQHDMLIFNDTTLYVVTYSLEIDSFKYGLFFTYPDGTQDIKHIALTDSLNRLGMMMKRDNGNYILFGGLNGGNVFWDQSLAIYEFDKNLNVISKFFTPSIDGYIGVDNFLQINEQEVLLLASHYDWDYIRSKYAYNHYILRYHIDNREILWSKSYGFPASNGLSGGRIVASHEANHFIYCTDVAGEGSTIDSFIEVGRIIKVDGQGNQVWQRDYSYFSDNGNSNDLDDIIATSDGNYLVGGNVIGSNGLHGWLLKINEFGEIVGDSLVNVQWTERDWNKNIKIYPNPTSGHIYINQNNLDHVTYELFNAKGNFINQIDVKAQNQGIVWNLSTLVNGSYYIRMKIDRKVIGSTVIMKQ